MNYKIANRGEGKTSWIIEQAHKNGCSILVGTNINKKYVEQIIKERGYDNIPHVYSWTSDTVNQLCGTREELYVDDADMILKHIIGCNIKGMSLNK